MDGDGGLFQDDALFDVDEVAERLKIAPRTVRNWINDGQLEGYLLGGAGWRVSGKALNAFLARHRQAPKDEEDGDAN